MLRRNFLVYSAKAGVGLSFASLAMCAERNGTRANPNPITPTEALVSDFETKLPNLMADLNVPGASIAVIHEGKLVWCRGFGVKDVVTKAPVDNDTIFDAGSMSKPVFAYLALKLCEKGVIGLDIPLTQYASEPFLTGDPQLERITPRHVLSHSSGFQNFRSGNAPLKIHFAPGSQYRYSGEGYYYLQSVISHLTGKVNRADCARFEDDLEVCATDIAQFMEANLIAPFGMSQSGYVANESRARHMATGHDSSGKPFPKAKSTGPATTRYAAVGGLQTTPADFAKFIIEVLDPKASDDFRLRKETIAEMLRPHVKVVNGPETSSWGLGWQNPGLWPDQPRR